MSGMRTVVVDKIASVTQACGLSHEVRISPEIPCEEGLVLVVEILNSKANYNTLELTSGRMAKVVRAWLDLTATDSRPRDPANGWLADWARAGADKAKALDNEALFPSVFRSDARLRSAILGS